MDRRGSFGPKAVAAAVRVIAGITAVAVPGRVRTYRTLCVAVKSLDTAVRLLTGIADAELP